MHSPCLREASQLWLHGCCPTPLLKGESDQPIAKTRSTSSACRCNFVATTAASLFPNTQFTNHESIPCLQESFVQFIKTYPNYSDTAPIDQIRAREYPHLSLSNHVCLDYMGVGLFSQTQVKSVTPSSSPLPDFPLFSITFKPVSLKSQLHHGGEGSDLESAIKKRIMDFLNISQTDYAMVFTANRSASFKLVAESYPFQSTTRKLVTVYDHQSDAMDAMVSTSEKRGARAASAEFKWPRLRIHSARLRKIITRKHKSKAGQGLFVFPLQSRMSGASYSYQWMTLAQEHGWHVLLDACALGPKDMHSFGLSLFRPDFLISSFYKVFGENPTGFGCLFVKKSIVPMLEASAGAGIVAIIPPPNVLEDSSGTDTELDQIAAKNPKPEEVGLEKQIAPFKDINKSDEHQRSSNSIQCRCLDHVDSLGLTLIGSRGRYLINWLVIALKKLQHPNRLENFPLVTIYGPKVKFDRGPALAFNIHDWKGEMVEPALVQKLADRNNISLSHGFLHHIWFSDKVSERNSKGKGDHQGVAIVTAALTFLANFEDVYRLWAFIAQFLDADFVEKERWRYTALDQKTVQV